VRTPIFFNRDISWLSFNERLLIEAATPAVPLLERLRFLSIFSSNLDEFYRVRIPALMAFGKLERQKKKSPDPDEDNSKILEQVVEIIHGQQQKFGSILKEQLIPQLKENNIYLVYNEPIPEPVKKQAKDYFFNTLAGYLKTIAVKENHGFFPENNRLYIAVTLEKNGKESVALVNIPSEQAGRFFISKVEETSYLIFIDDIIRDAFSFLFRNENVTGAYSVKITRDAELDLLDEYEGDIAEKIEKQISKRDYGFATRFLYQPGLPLHIKEILAEAFQFTHANHVEGGNYHNLKDLSSLPVLSAGLVYPAQPPYEYQFRDAGNTLFSEIREQDILINAPYQSYNTVLRFFNEAATDNDVEEIYTTLYRVASDSKIAHALISAAVNGKKVTVFVELKARFDESNNIKWSKRMKAAGIKVIYSIPGLKVHAKVALVKRRYGTRHQYLGLLATGNLNESTARFYTDHILLTAHTRMLQELELLFLFLGHRKKAEPSYEIPFEHLLVAQFNLQKQFLDLIDQEIQNAAKGLSSGITIKLNNLEERVLISKLYEASNAGVKINLLVRSICCLIPGVPGMSENITVKRIVDRYLEHGRIFLFNHDNKDILYLGSSDWMNRNIYRRIEVCFPVYDKTLKNQIKTILSLQLQDDVSAVELDTQLNNLPCKSNTGIRSQQSIYEYLNGNMSSGTEIS
jgi:polyphosphate kinase